jgi:hypothetical protein
MNIFLREFKIIVCLFKSKPTFSKINPNVPLVSGKACAGPLTYLNE